MAKEVEKKENFFIKLLYSGIFFAIALLAFTITVYFLVSQKLDSKKKEDPNKIAVDERFYYNFKDFRINLLDQGILKINLVAEFNRGDKEKEIDSVRMKLRDKINSYFIKLTKKDIVEQIKIHKVILKGLINEYITDEKKLKVKKPFIGAHIPLRVIEIYVNDFMILKED